MSEGDAPPSGEFEVRREVELPATPEEVWDAVTTEAGLAAWLFPSGEDLEPREGATSADGSTTVTAADRPHRFAVRTEGEGGWFNALEFVIEGREGSTLLRYAHSGIFVDDWDNQYDAVRKHTDFYLHTLGQYLEHFADRSATFVGDGPGGISAPASSAERGGFVVLKRALGLEDPAVGDRVSLAPAGVDAVEGVVDYATPNFLGVRTDDALYRFFGRDAFGMPVGMAIHSFAANVDADELERAWQDWLSGVYAQAA
jgi:uncharacterized protein YndB with AHSA1/START domain